MSKYLLLIATFLLMSMKLQLPVKMALISKANNIIKIEIKGTEKIENLEIQTYWADTSKPWVPIIKVPTLDLGKTEELRGILPVLKQERSLVVIAKGKVNGVTISKVRTFTFGKPSAKQISERKREIIDRGNGRKLIRSGTIEISPKKKE